MKHNISTIKINKRGLKYTTRSNGLANGFMKHYGNDSKKMTDEMRILAVYGTFDKLARRRFDIVWITITHPIDKDYTKRVAILNKNRRKFYDRIIQSERNKIIFKPSN